MTRFPLAGLAAFAIFAALAAAAPAARAATFTVDVNTDGPPVPTACMAGSVAPNCSLREAVLAANANPGTVDTIAFAPGLGTITLSLGMLPIVDAVTIEGCAAGAAATQPCVGIRSNPATDGIVPPSGSTVRGVALTGFNTAVRLGGDSAVTNSWIGVKVDGAAEGNGTGVEVLGAGNTIGGDTGAAQNTISNSTGAAIWIRGGASANVVRRNVGTGNGGLFVDVNDPAGAGNPAAPPTQGGVQSPTILIATTGGALGGAEPGSTVRLYTTTGGGSLGSFLGSAVTDASGVWVGLYSGVPAGTRVTAAQTTTAGNSSELSDSFVAIAVAAGAATTTAGPALTGASPAGDVAPQLVASLTNRRFRVARVTTALSAALPRGTTFRYLLSEDARVTISIARATRGVRVGRRCLAPRRGRTGASCTRYVRAGALVRSGRAGTNAIRFTGRVGRRALAPGSYRATLVARDSSANASAPRTLAFAVAPG
jgi:hypothetical protein